MGEGAFIIELQLYNSAVRMTGRKPYFLNVLGKTGARLNILVEAQKDA
jgi:hypothetical protein